MEDVFGELPPEGQTSPQQGGTQPPEQQAPEPQEQPQQPPPEEPGAAAPPAADAVKQVPFEALEQERNERKDWKAKAIRAEAERDQWRQRYETAQQPQPQQQPQEVDPMQRQVARMENVVLNASERAARRDHGAETVDKAWQRVQQEFGQNPALYQQIVGAADPWDQVVQHGKRLLAMDEIGSDPVAYRKKVEEEIRSQLVATAAGNNPQSQQTTAPRLPESLAGARSAGARGTTFTGPVPFETLFPN